MMKTFLLLLIFPLAVVGQVRSQFAGDGVPSGYCSQSRYLNTLNGDVYTCDDVNHVWGSPSQAIRSATNITTDATHRFTTDAEKSTWNGKQDALGFTAVPNTRTVNGQALSANISLTKSDIGLGSVTNSDTSTTANITDATNKRFVTDAQRTVIQNTSGTNTGDQDLSSLAPKASPALSGTPNIAAATGTSLAVTGALTSSGTAGIGYASGAGGTVTQATSKSTGVTLNKLCGTITMNGAALAAATIVTFTVTNSTVAATDVISAQHDSVGTIGAYTVMPNTSAAGSFKISLRNNTAGSLSEAIVIRFVVIKAAVN